MAKAFLMDYRICVSIATTFIVCTCGCNDRLDTVTRNATSSETQESRDLPIIEPGFFNVGPEYEHVSDVLGKSNASIRLDYHQGIEWYDDNKKTWTKINNIEDIKPLMAAAETKDLVTFSTGKAMWDKYDEYVQRIAEYANELGFDMTVVTVDHAEGLIVSKVIQHGN